MMSTLSAPSPGSITDIGDRLELFLDDALIGSMSGVELRLHAPVPREVVLRFDQPWDGPLSGSLSVVKDGSLFRLYHEGFPRWMAKTLRCNCVAESEDGVHFTRPKLGLYPRDGRLDNNVVYVIGAEKQSLHIYSVFLDDRPGVAEDQRYKGVGGFYRTGGVHVFGSPDGYRWRLLKPDPVIRIGPLDTNHVAFWSPSEQCYVCYFRLWVDVDAQGRRWWIVTRQQGDAFVHAWQCISEPGLMREFEPHESLENTGWRWTGRATSRDFLNWSDPVDLGVDGPSPLEHVYSNMVCPYYRAPHHYIAPAVRFVRDRRFPTAEHEQALDFKPVMQNKATDMVLITSRGGDRLRRTFLESWIRPGLEVESWIYGSNYPCQGLVPTGDGEVSFYVNTHFTRPSAHVRRYTCRVDGFASLHAGYRGGEAVTHPLTFRGGQLLLNYSTSVVGEVRVGVLTEAGQPVAGLSAADCHPMIGNCIEQAVRWRDDAKPGLVEGRPVRLQFQLRDADVFSMRFGDPR